MKNPFIPPLAAALTMALLAGCSWSIGGSSKAGPSSPTLGQSLIDLQRARDAGVITDAEYQTQKARLLAK